MEESVQFQPILSKNVFVKFRRPADIHNCDCCNAMNGGEALPLQGCC